MLKHWEGDKKMGILYIVLAMLFIGGTGFLAFFAMRKFSGNMGSNIGKANNKRWGMDEGQERDWY